MSTTQAETIAGLAALQQTVEGQLRDAEQRVAGFSSEVARLDVEIALLEHGPERTTLRGERERAQGRLIAARGQVERAKGMLAEVQRKADEARVRAAVEGERARQMAREAKDTTVAAAYEVALRAVVAAADAVAGLEALGQRTPRQFGGLIDGLVELQRLADSHNYVTRARRPSPLTESKSRAVGTVQSESSGPRDTQADS